MLQRLSSYRLAGLFALAMLLMLFAVWPTLAAPPAQEEEAEITDVAALSGDVTAEERGAFAMLAQAERAVAAALAIVEAQPSLAFEEQAVVLEGEQEGEEGGELSRQFQILEPSTIVTLAATHSILGTVAQSLDDFQTIIEADVAEELTISEDILGETDVEEDEGVIEEEEEEEQEVPEQEVLQDVDIDVELAGGECGDIDTLVRVTRRDIARALGRFGRFGGADPSVDPERRLLALQALRIHGQQLQDTLSCLSDTLGQE